MDAARGARALYPLLYPRMVPFCSQEFRRAIDEKTSGRGELIFGASHSYLSREALHQTLFRLVNVLVYVNHHVIAKGANCSVAFPSGQFFEDNPLRNNVIEDMLRHRDKVICKSVNLAVFRYALQSADAATVGTTCRQEQTNNYAEVCPPLDHPSDHEPTWVAVHYQRRFNFITYEDQHSLREKIAALRQVLSSICIAAFRIELEDHSTVCPHRRSFSRLINIRQFLEEPMERVPRLPDLPDHTVKGDSGTPSSGPAPEQPAGKVSGRLAREPRSSDQLVCFVSPPVKTLQGYPTDSCDYLVYHPTGYDLQQNRFYQPDDASWSAFLNMKRVTKFLVSVDAQSVADVERNSSVVQANFVRLVPLWLSKYELGGIGLLLSPRDDLLLLHSALTRLREHLARYRKGTFRLWLGAPPTVPVSTGLAELTDLFIYTTNHVPMQGPCRVSYPSVLPQMSTVSEPLLAAKHLKANIAANLTVCLSVNLAVLVFWQETVDRKVGASCKQGSETDYAELCRQVEIKIRPDSEWMAAFLQADDNNTLYTFETEEMLSTKVTFFKSWFPDICLAVFHTERDVYGDPCPKLPAFSRLSVIRNTLDAVADHRRAPSRSRKALQAHTM